MNPQDEQYSIVQIMKHRTIASTLVNHIMRKKEKMVDGKVIEDDFYPANADPEKGVGNRILIDPITLARKSSNTGNLGFPDNSIISGMTTSGVTRLSIMHAINNRIRECGIKTRKGQNLALEIVITGSHETMVSMSDNIREQWVNETLNWVKHQFGEENIMAAVLHMDETTPHIHFIVVPIRFGASRRTESYLRKQKKDTGKEPTKEPHKQYRLSADAFFTTRKKKDYHSSYSEEVGEHFGLRRPIEAESGSRKSHIESIELNRQLKKEGDRLEKRNQELKKQYDALQSKVEESERTNKVLTESINRQNEELSRVKKESDQASYRRNLDREIAKSIDAEALLKKSPETLTSRDLLQLIAKCRDLIAKNVQLNYDSKMARQEKDSLQLKFDKLNRAWHSPKELRLRLSHYSDYTEEVLECLEERFGCAIDEEWLKIIETREGLACFATIPKAGGETIRVAITPQKEMRATSYTIVKTYDDAVRWWKQPQIWSFDTTLRSVKDAKREREYWDKQESEHPSEQSTGLRIRR